jgi:hypothetical protein
MTPLHYAVTRRSTAPDHSYVMSLIRGVALINAEAGETQCSEKGFTPLAYACDSSSSSDNDDLVWDAEVIRTLHEANDIAMDVKSKRGHPPLSIHIMSISRRKFYEQSTRTQYGFESPGTCPILFRRLKLIVIQHCFSRQLLCVALLPLTIIADGWIVLDLLLKKSSQEDMVNALETLYSCNTVAIMQRYAAEEARKRRNLESKGLDTWWVTSCMVKILKAIDFDGSDNDENNAVSNSGAAAAGRGGGSAAAAATGAASADEEAYFSPLHTLSLIKDCPTPFLLLAMRAADEDLQTQDHATGNLPIHNVASWSLPEDDSVCRKSMGWTSLLYAFPDSADQKNDFGQTPT